MVLILLLFLLQIGIVDDTDRPVCRQLTHEEVNQLLTVYNEAVHHADQEKLFEAWTSTLRAIGRHLREGGYVWQDTTRVFFYLFFSPDGTIDHALYSIHADLSYDDEQNFRKQVENFAKEWKFPLIADVPLAQCGTAIFVPPTE